jgi:hypothetical protein
MKKTCPAPTEGDHQVAAIAASNDPEIGKIIADAMKKVGQDASSRSGARGLETEVGRRRHAVRPRLPVTLRDEPRT